MSRESGAPSWEEFRAAAQREVNGQTIYLVEWDTPVTLDQLRDYYDRNVARSDAGMISQQSTVDQENGKDNIWLNAAQLRLTYCVSSSFLGHKQRAVAEMAAATHAWEAVANVSFRYVPSEDGNCSNANSSIAFAVRPWTSGGACAFFPDGSGCDARTLNIDFNDFDTNPDYVTDSPNMTTVGVFRHELGHILGLRHEHIRGAGSCIEDSSWRALTAYDQGSVMHYPFPVCDGILTSDLSITSLDREGINMLYPFDFSTGHDAGEKYDLNNDGKADVCGRGAAGVYCALSNGTGYGPTTRWNVDYSDANGWNRPEYYSTIRFPDVNGDHRADICGRGADGIWCAVSNGSGFGVTTRWAPEFSDGNSWGLSSDYYSTIQYPDVNHDGRADVCGRGADGVWCALSLGAGFAPVTRWTASFGDGDGWNAGPEYSSTIRFPDVNGDGRADLCGRGGDGVWCALSSGASFGAPTLWAAGLSDPAGWNKGPEYYSTIRFPDVNGDGKADLCGRSAAGLRCAMSSGSGFGSFGVLVPEVSDASGWNQSPAYYGTIMFGDLNGDGRADMCGRGAQGVYCARSTGTGFTSPTLGIPGFSDDLGWNKGPYYYSTLRMADFDGNGSADVCGRGAAGIYCATSTGAGFTTATKRTTSFSDIEGWAVHLYYSTLHFP